MAKFSDLRKPVSDIKKVEETSSLYKRLKEVKANIDEILEQVSSIEDDSILENKISKIENNIDTICTYIKEQKETYSLYDVKAKQFIDCLKEDNETKSFVFLNEEKMEFSRKLAEKLINVFDSLVEENQESFISLAISSKEGFNTIVDFAESID